MDARPGTVGLTHCPDCHVPVVYEKLRTGLVRLHDLGDEGLVFLCPEDPVPVRKGEG
jgi:hypothetical protein